MIVNDYNLNNITKKYRKSFWINPSFNWIGAGINGANRFTLSQWIIAISLININQNSSSSRRLLSVDTNNQYNIQYGISSEYIVASNLNINMELVTTWDVKMNINCLNININDIQQILLKDISDCSSPILQLGIVSINNNNNNCLDGNSIIIRFILAFANSEYIFFDLQKFLNEKNIISIIPVNIVNTSIITIVNNTISNSNNNNNNIYIISIILGTVMICSIIIIYYKIIIQKNKKDDVEKCESAITFNNNWENQKELPNWINKE